MEKHENLDTKTKDIFESSRNSKTVDLLRSLNSLKAKNDSIFSKFKKSKDSSPPAHNILVEEPELPGFNEIIHINDKASGNILLT